MPVVSNLRSTKSQFSKGFTLVELLVAVSLIAVLSGVLFSVINPKGIQAKARDSQRASDLAKIKVALENYFSDHRMYPPTISMQGGFVPVSSIEGELVPGYINKLPEDPRTTNTVCVDSSEWRGYAYKAMDNASSYILATAMETDSMGNPCQTCSGCRIMPGKGSVYYTTSE